MPTWWPLYERQRAAGWCGRGPAAGPSLRSVPDRDRPRRARPHRRRRRRRGAALPGVRRNSVAGQGRRPVKVIVEADGGSRGNPGPAGYGSVVWTADRQNRAGREQAGDRSRHQQRRRIPRPDRRPGGGGQAGRHRGRRPDGLQAGGRADVRPLAGQASRPEGASSSRRRRSATTFDRISYAWIPRAENSHADRLANEAMDAAAELEAERRRQLESRVADHPGGLDRRPRRSRPGSCCCGTGRPNCRRNGGIRVAGTRR